MIISCKSAKGHCLCQEDVYDENRKGVKALMLNLNLTKNVKHNADFGELNDSCLLSIHWSITKLQKLHCCEKCCIATWYEWQELLLTISVMKLC